MFLATATIPERVKGWVSERIKVIESSHPPVNLSRAAWLALHIVPAASLSGRLVLDVRELAKAKENLKTFRDTETEQRYNLHGVIRISRDQYNSSTATGYLQAFREGRIELVATTSEFTLYIQERNSFEIDIFSIEDTLLQRTKEIVDLLATLGIDFPLAISVTMGRMTGLSFHIPPNTHSDLYRRTRRNGALKISEDRLELPEIWLSEKVQLENLKEYFRPTFDTLWNSCGYEASPSYSDD